jgi:hypothetical protein
MTVVFINYNIGDKNDYSQNPLSLNYLSGHAKGPHKKLQVNSNWKDGKPPKRELQVHSNWKDGKPRKRELQVNSNWKDGKPRKGEEKLNNRRSCSLENHKLLICRL